MLQRFGAVECPWVICALFLAPCQNFALAEAAARRFGSSDPCWFAGGAVLCFLHGGLDVVGGPLTLRVCLPGRSRLRHGVAGWSCCPSWRPLVLEKPRRLQANVSPSAAADESLFSKCNLLTCTHWRKGSLPWWYCTCAASILMAILPPGGTSARETALQPAHWSPNPLP